MSNIVSVNGLQVREAGVQNLIEKIPTAQQPLGYDGIFEQQIIKLKALRDLCLEKEMAFYSECGITMDEDNPQDARLLLQQRLDEISYNTGLHTLVDRPHLILVELRQYIGLRSSQLLEDVVIRELNNTDAEWFTMDNGKPLLDNIIDVLNENFRNNPVVVTSGKSSKQVVSYFQNVDSRGFKKHFEIDEEGKIKSTGKIPAYFSDRILRALNKEGGKAVPKPTDAEYATLKKDIFLALSKFITDTNVLYQVFWEIWNNLQSYDINTNEQKWIGFLGEIHNAVLFNTLMNKPNQMGTIGAIRTSNAGSSRVELPIDQIFKEFNFQVKNYTLDKRDSSVNFKGQMGATNFIDQRARISGELRTILVQLFAAAEFNKPFENLPEDSSYPETYSSLLFTTMDTNSIFNMYISNIIKLSSEFSAELPQFSEYQTYVNHFFVINGKYIPSSAILQSIIDTYEFGIQNLNIARFSIDNLSIPDGGTKLEGNRNVSALSADSVANEVKLSWRVNLNLKDILQNVYNRIQRLA